MCTEECCDIRLQHAPMQWCAGCTVSAGHSIGQLHGRAPWFRAGSACRYIPLEVLNDDFRALDKADVFMLGASLYELATNKALETGARPLFF